MVLGFACALILGALFYGTMVYQLSGENARAAQSALDAPLRALSLAMPLEEEHAAQEVVGGRMCSVTYRTYVREDGKKALAISAQGAAYFERLSQEGWTPLLITGFTLAGLDAVCYVRGEDSMLAARQGECVYLLMAQADEQELYALGAAAALE